MPKELWAEAVALARVEGAYAVARDLELSYATLPKRLEQATGRGGHGHDSGGEEASARSEAEILSGLGAGGSVVELTRSDGAKLTMRLAGAGALDVVAPSEAFFGRRR